MTQGKSAEGEKGKIQKQITETKIVQAGGGRVSKRQKSQTTQKMMVMARFYEQQLNKAQEDAPNPNLVLAKSQPPHGSVQKPNYWYSGGAAHRENSFPPLPIPSCLLVTFSSSPEPTGVWFCAGPPRASLCCSLQHQKDTWENTTYNTQPHTWVSLTAGITPRPEPLLMLDTHSSGWAAPHPAPRMMRVTLKGCWPSGCHPRSILLATPSAGTFPESGFWGGSSEPSYLRGILRGMRSSEGFATTDKSKCPSE